MEKLIKIIQRCKADIHLTINDHKSGYETVEQYFKSDRIALTLDEDDVESLVFDKMKEMDTIIELHFYPDSPVGCYRIFHYNLEMALDVALEILNVE